MITPGDLVLIPIGSDLGLEWLIVRFHVDDPSLVLLVPVDSFPLQGTVDLTLRLRRPYKVYARCGLGVWLLVEQLHTSYRADKVPAFVLKAVRKRMANLARGVLPPRRNDDWNCDYTDWLDEIMALEFYL